jgi:hypothetical protein
VRRLSTLSCTHSPHLCILLYNCTVSSLLRPSPRHERCYLRRALSFPRRCSANALRRPACSCQCVLLCYSKSQRECSAWPFLYATVNSTKTPTAFSTSETRKANGAANMHPRYSEAPEVAGKPTERPVKMIKASLVPALENQRQEKQDAQKRTGTTPAPQSEPSLTFAKTVPPAPHGPEESDSDDSDVPLAKMLAKRARPPADAPSKCGEGDPLPPKKRRTAKTKALPTGDDAPDKASTLTKVKPAAHSPPPRKRARVRVDRGGAGKARLLQENTVPANVPRKRKKRTRTMPDATQGKNEHEHEPPRKRSRRADSVVRCVIFSEHLSLSLDSYSRRRKSDGEITRSAREVSKVMMDRVRRCLSGTLGCRSAETLFFFLSSHCRPP